MFSLAVFVLSIVYNFSIVLLALFVIAFALTKMLNPTASVKEIFEHWKNPKGIKNG